MRRSFCCYCRIIPSGWSALPIVHVLVLVLVPTPRRPPRLHCSCCAAAELKEYPLGLPVLVLDAKTALFGTTVINSFLAQKLGRPHHSTPPPPDMPIKYNTVDCIAHAYVLVSPACCVAQVWAGRA